MNCCSKTKNRKEDYFRNGLNLFFVIFLTFQKLDLIDSGHFLKGS